MMKGMPGGWFANRAIGWAGLAIAGMLASGCNLGEVTAAQGGDVLVVEAQLEANSRERQYVLLHRSLQNGEVRPEPGATVTVTGPDGVPVEFTELPSGVCAELPRPGLEEEEIPIRVSCYATGLEKELFVLPGETYELEVVSRSGERIRGRTTVPGDFAGRRPSLPPNSALSSCWLAPRTNIELMWSQSEGAWSYLANLEIVGLANALQGSGFEVPDPLELTGLSISQTDTTLVLPREFGLFELTNVDQDVIAYLQDGFPAGVSLRLRVSALDRNYVNAIRGGTFNPSGAIRISSVVGDGIGVFGSYVPRDLFVVVEEEAPLPPC